MGKVSRVKLGWPRHYWCTLDLGWSPKCGACDISSKCWIWIGANNLALHQSRHFLGSPHEILEQWMRGKGLGL